MKRHNFDFMSFYWFTPVLGSNHSRDYLFVSSKTFYFYEFSSLVLLEVPFYFIYSRRILWSLNGRSISSIDGVVIHTIAEMP